MQGSFQLQSELYNRANELYVANRYEDSLALYGESVSQCDQSITDDEERLDVMHRCILNRAQCFSKLRNFEEAVKECTRLIKNYTPNQSLLSKALIRRALNQEFLGNFAAGITDLENALQIVDIAPSLAKVAINALSKFKNLAANDDAVTAAEGRPTMMLSAHQALRFNFLNTIPAAVELGEYFPIRLCIGNELGLWDKRLVETALATTSAEQPVARLLCGIICMASNEDDLAGPHSVILEFESQEPLLITSSGKFNFNVRFVKKPPTTTTSATTTTAAAAARNGAAEDSIEAIPEETEGNLFCLKFSLDRALPGSGARVHSIITLPIFCSKGTHVSGGGGASEDAAEMSSSSSSCPVPLVVDHIRYLCNSAHANCIRCVPLLQPVSTLLCSAASSSSAAAPSELGKDIDKLSMSEQNNNSSYHQDLPKRFAFCFESVGYFGIGGKVWDSSYVMLEYLNQHYTEYVKGKRVLELGSGTGILGISLCTLGPRHVTLTDYEEIVPPMRANIELNMLMVAARGLIPGSGSSAPDSSPCKVIDTSASASSFSVATGNSISTCEIQECLRNRYAVVGYKWGTPMPPPPSVDSSSSASGNASGCGPQSATDSVSASNISVKRSSMVHRDISICTENFDIIIASDVVYYPAGYQPLVDSVALLLRHYSYINEQEGGAVKIVKPMLILAHRNRHPDDYLFFDLLAAVPNISIERIDFTASSEAGGSSSDRSDGSTSTLTDVKLMRVQLTA